MRRLHLSKFRPYVLASGVLLIIGASVVGIELGTYCAICPVGFLQVTAASRSIPIDMLAGVIIGLIAVIMFGRFFCSWFCTTTLVRQMFSDNNTRDRVKDNKYLSKLPFAIMLLLVGLSFIVKFPIFCLVCPIGLFFGFIFAVLKVFFVLEPSWNLIIFPVIIAVEVLVFRKWCSYICPISALFSLFSKIPFLKIRPKVGRSTCISCNGKTCNICIESCPENIEVNKGGSDMITKCTSCIECIDKCPTHSISFSVIKGKKK